MREQMKPSEAMRRGIALVPHQSAAAALYKDGQVIGACALTTIGIGLDLGEIASATFFSGVTAFLGTELVPTLPGGPESDYPHKRVSAQILQANFLYTREEIAERLELAGR